MKWLLAIALVAVPPMATGQTAQRSGDPVALQRAELFWKARRFDEANTAFRELIKQFPKNAEYRVRWGELYLDHFQPGDAAALFQEALQLQKDHPRALLGLARAAADGFEAKAVEFAQLALKADPKLVPAQELLARLALEDNNPEKAAEEANKALAMSPNALEAMAVLASVDILEDKPTSDWVGKALAKDPKNGQVHETIAHFLVLNRRYEEGIEEYRKALKVQPDLWSARSQLGVNLMRLGQEEEARKQLELCYENGQKDPATVNTLRLMDSYKNFVTFRTGTTILRLHKKEAEILRPYFQSELERAIRTYDEKYKIKLNRPVQVEVYPDHEDFAVRTMGMPGLGALGVTFGYVVAMDSPSGRRPGSFHWASTMWHELSHVYVLAATNHRVPRWFTEGMAVHEETAISPDWGDRLDAQAIMAIKNKKLLPVAELDRGFIRPNYPGQVIVSYFQAGRICDYIKGKWGYSKLLDMMHEFAKGTSTAEVIEHQLGMKPEAFDTEFLAKLEGDTKKVVEGFDEWRKQIRVVAEMSKAGRHDEVIQKAQAIRDLYPDYVEAGSVYELLSEAYLAKGQKAKAIEELALYSKIGGRDPELIKKLATLLEEEGKKAEASAALARLNFIQPIDEDLHKRLGELSLETGNKNAAIAEFQAVVAMKPMDPATANYNLARAYQKAGRPDDAREALISSLEAAPGFRPAQKMLLELSEGETNK